MSVYASGTDHAHSGHLYHRRKDPEAEVEEIIEQTNQLSISNKTTSTSDIFVRFVNPMVLTAISAFVRLYGINKSNSVVWDEAHFGKFGSHYLQHEFYFDVHPPLGKLLVGLSGWLAGYDGSFKFESGVTFPEDCNYVVMRCFNCLFGILVTPLTYKTAIAIGFSQWTVWLVCLMEAFEMISLVLSKFILLDSMLLFFTVMCYYGLVRVHQARVRGALLSVEGVRWLTFTGAAVGCVCSVKWVGLFVTAVVGLYTIYDLLIKFYQTRREKSVRAWKTYACHWLVRIITLIVVPFTIYLASFRAHFAVLSGSGPGDGSISTLLQASLDGNTLKFGPRSVAYGSLVTLRSQGLSPNLLHSHQSLYPEGSQQQQITTYGFKDTNNEFLLEFDLESAAKGVLATLIYENDTLPSPDVYTSLVKNGDTIRLVHKETGCLLHSHAINAHVLKGHYEVSCYADLDNSDLKDEWVIEIQTQEKSPSPHYANETPDEIHPVSTNFRLRHKYLGCYLATTGYSYPAWGFTQGEVVCKHSYLAKDKSTWWNIEDHVNEYLPQLTEPYEAPKPKFWKEFILLNYGMMASNNALIPDPDKFDKLSSEWWEWPILHSGLRMCGWGAHDIKYFMIGHPLITWLSTAAIPVVVVYLVVMACLWQRQVLSFDVLLPQFNDIIVGAILPLLGWTLHYLPFVIMGRVTYLHHYVPALYFAIFVLGYVVETFVAKRLNRYVVAVFYIVFYIAIVGIFWYLQDLVMGMTGPSKNYKHLKVLSSWMV